MNNENPTFPSHPTVEKSAEGWVAEEQEATPRWEIGRAFDGCDSDPDVLERQREVLQEFLDVYGPESEKWYVAPEIREHHNHKATIGGLDFGRRLAVNRQPCSWAAYGVLISRERPTTWHVPEGIRIPNEDR